MGKAWQHSGQDPLKSIVYRSRRSPQGSVRLSNESPRLRYLLPFPSKALWVKRNWALLFSLDIGRCLEAQEMERTPPLGPFPGSGFLSITHSPRKAANHDAIRTAHAKSRGYATAVPNALPCIWRGDQTMLGGRRTERFGAIICAALFPLVSPFTRQLSLL